MSLWDNIIGTQVGEGERINRNRFFDALQADRARGLQNTASGQLNVGLDTLESRGLGTSSSVGSLMAGINRQQGQGLQAAQSEIFGQKFALQQQLDAESRGFRRTQIEGQQDFERQAALMRLASELQKDGGGAWWQKLLGAAGGAAAGYLTGGVPGAVAGGAQGYGG